MAAQERYAEWFGSALYDKLAAQTDDTPGEGFIALLTSQLGAKPGNRILELGCGRGQHSRALASMGFDVTGIDLAPASIEQAKAGQGDKDNPQFFVHDIRLPFWGNYFDYVLSIGTGFGYFRTKREHEAAIRTISRSLRPDGVLVIDYPNTAYAANHLPASETKVVEGSTYIINQSQDEGYFYKDIRVSDASVGGEVEFREKLTKFSEADFKEMLSRYDMEVQQLYGDYQLAPYDVNQSPRLIVVAAKKDGQPADKEKRLYSDGRTTDALT